MQKFKYLNKTITCIFIMLSVLLTKSVVFADENEYYVIDPVVGKDMNLSGSSNNGEIYDEFNGLLPTDIKDCLGGNTKIKSRLYYNMKLAGLNGQKVDVFCIDRSKSADNIYYYHKVDEFKDEFASYLLSENFKYDVNKYGSNILENSTMPINEIRQLFIWAYFNNGKQVSYFSNYSYTFFKILSNMVNLNVLGDIGYYTNWEEMQTFVNNIVENWSYNGDNTLYIYSNNMNGYQRLIGKPLNPIIPPPPITEPDPIVDPPSTPDDDGDDRYLYTYLCKIMLIPKYYINDNESEGTQIVFNGNTNWYEHESKKIETTSKPDPLVKVGNDPITNLPIYGPQTYTTIYHDTTISYTVKQAWEGNNIATLTGNNAKGYTSIDGFTYNLTSKDTSSMSILEYFGSRYIFQKYYNTWGSEISESNISNYYRVEVNGTYKQKTGINDVTGYIDPVTPYSCNAKEKIYVNDSGYNKFNYNNTDSGYKWWATSEGKPIYKEIPTSLGTYLEINDSPFWNNKISDAYKIYFNYTFEPSSIIRVNHYVEDTDGNHTKDGKNYKRDDSIANDNEIGTIQEISGDELHELPKGYSERKTVYDWGNNGDSTPKTEWFGGCSEQYEIDASDRMSINRSSTILKDGYYYKCIGVSIGNGGIQTNRSLEVGISGDDGDQTINYYYEKVPYSVVEDPNDDYPDDDTPGRRNQLPGNKEGIEISKLKFAAVSSESRSYDKFLNETTFSQSGSISYVPAKENLRAYLEASIVKPKNLKYKIKVGGYDVERYTAYGIDDTYNVGSVNGINGSARENVYNGNTTSIHSAKQDEIKNSVYNSKNDLADDSYEVFNGTPVSTDSNIVGKLNKITYKYQTSKDYFKTDSDQYVNDNKYNGLRNPTGAIYYKEYDVMNHQKYGPTYTKKVSDSDTMDVNVYTPFDIGKVSIKSSNEVVDHSVEAEENGLAVIQQNADFTLEVLSNEDGACYQNLYTKVGGHNGYNFLHKYLKYFYVKLDFDVKITSGSYRVWTVNGSGDSATAINERWAKVGDVLEKGTIIRLVPNNGVGILKANAYSTGEDTSKVNYNKYKAYASTVNMPSEVWVVNQIAKSSYTSADSGTGTPYIDNKQVVLHGEDRSYQSVSGLKKDAFYIVSNLKKTVSLGRIFDFEITDCADVNFKNVFRKSETNTVNDLTGIAYYSGFYRLRLRDEWTGYNINYYTNRDEKSGITYGYVKTVLPLGPYKNISNEYMSAPKLGYRFSFDVKTSGYYDPLDEDKYSTDRRIEITPSYYYISKDGSKLIDNVKLYYKNSSGNYIPFENSGYTISYKPNDGYRTLLTDDTTSVKDGYLTSNLKTLNISKMFTLTGKDMITMSDHGFIQSWYGEFKLPNSTIILEKDQNGNVNINNPLKDGYIAVKFDMKCIDTYKDVSGSKQTVTIEYNKNNANDSRNNTTQWDYEGYLGFDVNRQNINDLKLQLEKGTYSVGTQDRYDQIKGTVALFDIDNRAADDFN